MRGKKATRFDIQIVFHDGCVYRRQSLPKRDLSVAELTRHLRETLMLIEKMAPEMALPDPPVQP
jgi:hypothetical protein